jgi:hypothetical protein
VNPANPSFTPSGVPDRTRAELTLQKYFGRAELSGIYGHVRDPKTTENTADVRLKVPVGQRIRISTGGKFVGQNGDAVAVGLPETDRTEKHLDLVVTETLGRLNLSQTVKWHDFTNESQPGSDERKMDLNLTANGALASFLTLSASLANIRTKRPPEVGTTNLLQVSLQPALTLARLWLALTPRADWTRFTNDRNDSESKTDRYQLVVRLSPPWAGAFLNFEVASDWNRSWTDLDPEPPSFDRETVLSLILNWRADRSWGPVGLSAARPLQPASMNPRALDQALAARRIP